MKKLLYRLTVSIFVLALLGMSLPLQAQIPTLPNASQEAKVVQTIGISQVGIWYHSPGARDRTIWGDLVPFDQVWRAGANENTLFWCTDDVKIEGQELKAGKYGLYMIPHEGSVDILFSSATQNWGTVAPREDEIVLKIMATPQKVEHVEWLNYGFADRLPNEATAYLEWGEWRIPFKVEVDVASIVTENLRAELRGIYGFNYQGREIAANWCAQNGINLEEALTWIDGSINSERRFSNLMVKSSILAQLGRTEEANQAVDQAMAIATPVQMNNYGYQLLGSNQTDEALSIFLKNVESCPKDHNFYWGFVDSVGEAYLKKGDIGNAKKYYALARQHAPENQHAYLDGVLKKLGEAR